MEYRFDPVQTQTIQDDATFLASEEKERDEIEEVTEISQTERLATELASAESGPEEISELNTPAEAQLVQEESRQTIFRIVEESDRIIVMQVEAPPTNSSSAK